MNENGFALRFALKQRHKGNSEMAYSLHFWERDHKRKALKLVANWSS